MRRLLALATVLGLILGIGVSFASDTNTVTVQANVVGTCKFLSSTSTLDFGSLDPSSGRDVNASTTVQFWCTKNTNYSISDDDGLYESGADQNRMKGPGESDYISYTFSYSPASGTGSGRTTPITLTISGSIAYANYKDAAAGNYSDTVVLTISP
jgi:spore coat protein U-like protein